ncbi:MAG: DEAD/DEAH box helicase family protein, partial [Xanthomonadales bacterium]|nr:DEAD/DEAH box helicase family protein [Xanthomonadales bacterium]
MALLKPGLYEQLLSFGLQRELDELATRHHAELDRLPHAEAPDRIALHLAQLIKRAVAGLDESERTPQGLTLARRIIQLLMVQPNSGAEASDQLVDGDRILRSIATLLPSGEVARVPTPDTPLLDTTLLTNAQGEPNIGHQLRTEIPSADRIDVLMAFVRTTGIRPLLELLRSHHENGRSLRVLTTTYTGSTELAALQALKGAGADIRISYDTSSTRLHAKAWLFHRNSGYSTAFIGSSNLTHSAQVTGLEWNVRVSGARNPDVIDKFQAVFESYWNNDDFRAFDDDEFIVMTRIQNDAGSNFSLSPIEIRPEPFQTRLLELIELARQRGKHRNLLVAATGTGKTVMAALDYQRLRARLPRARLLFVAHRKEILQQSRATFRHALRDAAFGELWVDGQKPNAFQHVFASIQSLSANSLQMLEPDYFDVLIIDEFHHAAANTYTALIDHLKPQEMLGLTATPERGDGAPILHWFDECIAAELRLWDAIDQHRLCPFAYYGISDGTDLTQIAWRRGRGYDLDQLTNLITGDGVVARLVIEQTQRHVSAITRMRALGFCVSITHAQFMARQFEQAGVAARVVTSQT